MIWTPTSWITTTKTIFQNTNFKTKKIDVKVLDNGGEPREKTKKETHDFDVVIGMNYDVA